MAKSPITIPFSTDGVEVALKDGVSLPANARGFVGVGFDGTTTKFILVDAGGRQFAAVTSLAETGWSPDPSVRQEGTDQVYTDVSGNLRVRAQVLTDEASFRDDFGGSSVTPTGTGTISVTNGDPAVTGTGTAFTTELVVGHYIRLSAHANSVLTRIASIESDTALTLEEGYLGANGSGAFVYSNWVVATSTGGSISVASSTVTITNGTGIGNVTAISRAGDYLPFSVLFEARISQRIANQTTILGLTDDVTGNPVVYAVFEFVGTDNTIIRCKTAADPDSIETTDVKLPSGLTSDAVGLHFEISVMSDEVLFVVNDKLVAKHKSHIPGPYTPLVLGAVVINTAAVGSNTSLYLDHVFFKNHDQLTVDAIGDNKPIPIQGVTGGVPVQVQFGTGTGASLPFMINLYYNASIGGLVSNKYRRVINYTVPIGFSAYLIRFASFQGEAAISRIISSLPMGSHNCSTNVYTAGSSYVSPQWAPIVEAEVTTTFASGSGNVTLTVTYTNQDGTGSRTGTIDIPKGSVVGTRWPMTLQAGDLGCRSIQAISASPTQVGIVDIQGMLQLAYHQDQDTTFQKVTDFAPGSITFSAGTVLAVGFAGGTVAKLRDFDVLIQLVPA